MQDFQDTKLPKRQAMDSCHSCETMMRAFVLNELGEPDFDGHRKAHGKLIEAEKVLQGYKLEATKKVIGWVIAVLVGAVGSGVVTWVQGHIN